MNEIRKLTFEILRDTLEDFYPQVRYSEMDGGIFYFSTQPLDHSSTIDWEDRTYRVLYSWQWTKYGNDDIGYVPVYCAELELVRD